MRSRSALLLLPAAALACAPAGPTPATTPPPAAEASRANATGGGGGGAGVASSIAARTGGMERQDGLLPIYTDPSGGRLLLEIPRDSTRLLMFTTLATGLGSNPVGLDRGASGDGWVTRFQRSGDRVLVIFENWNYRSSDSLNADLRRTVAEGFPARDRSYINRAYTKSFPENTEIDVAVTYTTQGNPGRIVSQIAPDGSAITLRHHITFVGLPDDGFRPRPADPRVGYFGIRFHDFAQPIGAMLEQRWASRHRLERVNPNDPNSPIAEPIRFYIDRGIPEPIRTATLEGARFWTEAFDAAGLRGGFVVDLLPEGVDPMDIRYNVVQWVNRNERGWSVGGSLADPRTGEILKGMARMDSHRARTAYNLYAGLMGADTPGDTAWVLGRVRQVTAHEIGHTIGIAHNFIASTYERGSIMDYPAPRVRLAANGEIDLSSIYDVGPGAFDVWAVRWGYGIFPASSEADSLEAIVEDGLRRGLLFLSDADARPDYSSDPRTNLWDDAATAGEFLRHQMAVREVALERFGLRNIRAGEPVALLQERFVPVYFMHRFAVASLVKAVGGMEYNYAVRGDGQQATRVVPAAQQRAALAQLAALLAPAQLAIPDTVVTLLAPRPYGYGGSVELFGSRTRPAFDEFGAARTLAQMIVDAVLQRDRLARLVQFAARPGDQLTASATIDAMVAATGWRAGAVAVANDREAAIRRVTQQAVIDAMLRLAADTDAATEVRALAALKLRDLQTDAASRARSGADEARAHWAAIDRDIARWFEDGTLPTRTEALQAPPGDPFGSDPDHAW